MVDAQHTHVGPTAATTLSNLAKGLIVDAQKADRTRGATGRGVHHIILRTQPAKGEAIATAGLLDQRGHAQGAKDAVVTLTHIILDPQYKARSKLAQWCTSPSKGGAIRKEAALGEQIIEGLGHGFDLPLVLLFDLRDMVGDAVEHAGGCFEQGAVEVTAQVALLQHLNTIFT